MSKPIISRQRAYQLQHRKAGLCIYCSDGAVEQGMCWKHYRTSLITKREYRRRVLGSRRRNLNSRSYLFEREREILDKLTNRSTI